MCFLQTNPLYPARDAPRSTAQNRISPFQYLTILIRASLGCGVHASTTLSGEMIHRSKGTRSRAFVPDTVSINVAIHPEWIAYPPHCLGSLIDSTSADVLPVLSTIHIRLIPKAYSRSTAEVRIAVM